MATPALDRNFPPPTHKMKESLLHSASSMVRTTFFPVNKSIHFTTILLMNMKPASKSGVMIDNFRALGFNLYKLPSSFSTTFSYRNYHGTLWLCSGSNLNLWSMNVSELEKEMTTFLRHKWTLLSFYSHTRSIQSTTFAACHFSKHTPETSLPGRTGVL